MYYHLMGQEELPLTDIKKAKKPRKQSISQQIIIKHVSGMEKNYNKLDWGREGRICKTLSLKYGAEFLLWATPPEGYKVPSLTFYYSVLGRNHLSDQLLEYSKIKSPPIQERTENPAFQVKIGEDILTIRKPKTLKEFLNYGKEIRTIRRIERNETREEGNLPDRADAVLP